MTSRPSPLVRAPVAALPRLHQIVLPTPWEIGPVQVYVVEDDPLTLIDTGVHRPAAREALEAAFEALSLDLKQVRRVVLTHYHTDHMGQAAALRAAGADLEVWVHEDDADDVEQFSSEREERLEESNELFSEHGVPRELLERQAARIQREIASGPPLAVATRVDRRLRDGERVPFKDFELEVLHAPGHTAGHVVLHESESGTLLTGDHLMGNAVPFTESFHRVGVSDLCDPIGRRPRFRGLPAYLESLRRLRGGSYRTILPAHGGILDRPARVIDEALLFYEVRVQRVERAVAKLCADRADANAWEIWQQLFPKLDPDTQMRTRMVMVIGALDVLEDEGRIAPLRRADGTIAFRPRPAQGALPPSR
jgi:glyoxylase-like metal-dependent hydrolase (beta-lactamase superfamily II)